MGALWWLLTDRKWDYGLAAAFGLSFLLTGGSNFVNPAEMTTFRWVVVLLEVAGASILILLGANGIRLHKPWRSTNTTAS